MPPTAPSNSISQRIALALAMVLVFVGMLNTMPEIPGLQDLARDLTSTLEIKVIKTKNHKWLGT